MSNETKMDGVVLEALTRQTVETAVELRRVEMFGLHREALERLAQRAMTHHGVHPKDLVMVCVDVDDPVWRHLVDHLVMLADHLRPDNDGAWDIRVIGTHPSTSQSGYESTITGQPISFARVFKPRKISPISCSTVGRGIQDVLDIAPRTSGAAKALTKARENIRENEGFLTGPPRHVAPSTVCIPVVVFSEGGASVFTVDPANAVSGTST